MYCVYLHRRKDNNKVFYVGMGKSSRPYKKSISKTNKWLEVNKQYGHTVEIVESNLTKEIASELEEFLIDFIPNLVNVHKTSCLTKSIPDYVNQYVYYDENSPTCLRWKITTSNKSIKDNVAGFSRNKKYQFICILGKLYPVHRVVMKLHGFTSNESCDHIDNNSLNNKISNLRFVTQRENNRNKKCHNYVTRNNNKSSHTGVSELKIKNKSGNFTYYAFVQWVDREGKHRNKTFSYLKYGIMEAISLACEFRNNINSIEFN